MKCPVCGKNVSELDEICPNCKTNFDEYEKEKRQFEPTREKTNADFLNAMAYINIILSVIGAIAIWINFSTIKVTSSYTYYKSSYTETIVNWYGIVGGFGILLAGFTLFFLLKTIYDIYNEVKGE